MKNVKRHLPLSRYSARIAAYTAGIGGYIRLDVEWIGVVITVYDIGVITNNVVHRYRLITGK